MAKIPKMKGYEVIEALDGQEALALAAQHPAPIELLLTDARMPRMQGSELCRWMRAMFPETRMVVMSSYSDLKLDFAVSLLVKPFGVHDLLAIVRRALNEIKAD